jgi:hypothetical protein
MAMVRCPGFEISFSPLRSRWEKYRFEDENGTFDG